MERGAVGCLSNDYGCTRFEDREFLCAALLISFGEGFVEWLLRELPLVK